jgi:hypothetical protein
MNEAFDLDMESVLRRAGAAAEPADARLDRVFERMHVGLEGLGNQRPTQAHKLSPRTSASRLGAQLRFLSWGALTASVGFWLGIQYARETPTPDAAVPPSVLTPSAQTLQLPPSASPPAPLVGDTADDAVITPDAPVADSVPSEVTGAVHRAPSPQLASQRLRSHQRTTPRLDFRAVLDHLRRAERAERGGMPELALSLLDEIDRGAAPSILREERLLTRVLALCDHGDVRHARLRARELGHTTDDSIYASRLRASCVSEKEEP